MSDESAPVECALYRYVGTGSAQLSCEVGDAFVVVARDASGWTYVQLRADPSRQGWLPDAVLGQLSQLNGKPTDIRRSSLESSTTVLDEGANGQKNGVGDTADTLNFT